LQETQALETVWQWGWRSAVEPAPIPVPAKTNSVAIGDVGLEYCRRPRSSFVDFVGTRLLLRLWDSMEDLMLLLAGRRSAIVADVDRTAAAAAVGRTAGLGCTKL